MMKDLKEVDLATAMTKTPPPKPKAEAAAAGEPKLKWISRPVKILIGLAGEPMFSEQATTVEAVDEAAGEFLRITQIPGQVRDQHTIDITDRAEWNEIKKAVDFMIGEIEKYSPRDA